jgi:hypothetical protein
MRFSWQYLGYNTTCFSIHKQFGGICSLHLQDRNTTQNTIILVQDYLTILQSQTVTATSKSCTKIHHKNIVELVMKYG